MHGEGTIYFTNGDIYEGDWKDDKANGKGKFIWKSGNIYEGDWKDDNKNGKGKYVWCNGDYFEGEYKNDEENGEGIRFNINGCGNSLLPNHLSLIEIYKQNNGKDILLEIKRVYSNDILNGIIDFIINEII